MPDHNIDIQQIPIHEFYIHSGHTFHCRQEKERAPNHAETDAENLQMLKIDKKKFDKS